LQVATLVLARHAGRVALLHRAKEPNRGLWSPPGGKLEPGESPLDGALRELAEETGLVGRRARLRVVVSELDAVKDEAWLMFVFLVEVDDDTLGGDAREGPVAWVALADVPALAAPPADGQILAAALDERPGVAFLSARYEDGRLADVALRWADGG
jgi:8-oxo-dGTP diphosphatase